MASASTDSYETNLPQHFQVLRYGRLLQTQRNHDLAHLTLLICQVLENLPAPGLGHGVEWVGGSCCSCHAQKYIPI
jgi:hypothetical protein